MAGRMGKLMPRRQAFVEEYLVDMNAKQAAIRAGYSPRGAKQIGSRLLTFVDVQVAIQERQQARRDRLQLDGDRVLRELSRLGDSDLRNYISWGPDGVRLKDSSDLTEAHARAVLEVRETRRTIRQGKGKRIEEVQIRFKLHDKKGALDSLAKAHGLFAKHSAMKHLDTLLEVVLLVLRKYVAPDQVERAISDFETLVDSAQLSTVA